MNSHRSQVLDGSTLETTDELSHFLDLLVETSEFFSLHCRNISYLIFEKFPITLQLILLESLVALKHFSLPVGLYRHLGRFLDGAGYRLRQEDLTHKVMENVNTKWQMV